MNTASTTSSNISQPSVESVHLIQQLIAFNTVSRESNLGMVEWCRDYLVKHGAAPKLSYDSVQKKANLFVTLGDGDKPGLILSGHTDTVPVDGQDWATDPFVATLLDGNLYGRGSADMKGFIGTCLAMVPAILASTSTRPIHLALTYDEETTMLGARNLIADLRDSGLAVAGCIVGEPTDMRMIVGHKGRRHLRCCVRGKEAHSSLTPTGVNAIEYAAQIIGYLRSMADRHKQFEQRHFGYDVPYTTIQTGLIQGGLSANTVPSQCDFDFEFRNLPWTDLEKLETEVRDYVTTHILPDMKKDYARSEVTFHVESTLPPFDSTLDNQGLNAEVSELLKKIGRKHQALGYVGFGTEASWFQDAGIPTLVCGPGSIEQAHKPNEHIALEQIAQCEAFISQLIRSGS